MNQKGANKNGINLFSILFSSEILPQYIENYTIGGNTEFMLHPGDPKIDNNYIFKDEIINKYVKSKYRIKEFLASLATKSLLNNKNNE